MRTMQPRTLGIGGLRREVGRVSQPAAARRDRRERHWLVTCSGRCAGTSARCTPSRLLRWACATPSPGALSEPEPAAVPLDDVAPPLLAARCLLRRGLGTAGEVAFPFVSMRGVGSGVATPLFCSDSVEAASFVEDRFLWAALAALLRDNSRIDAAEEACAAPRHAAHKTRNDATHANLNGYVHKTRAHDGGLIFSKQTRRIHLYNTVLPRRGCAKASHRRGLRLRACSAP